MREVDGHFRRGIEFFNRGEFFEAHEEMEEAMNLLEDDSGDWDFYLGLLRASVANHKLSQHETSSAILHLHAALKFLAPFPDRHRGLKLREFRSALTAQLSRLQTSGAAAEPRAPRLEFDSAGSSSGPHE
jgi:predicted metal-dependent hydrolase